MDTPAMGDAFAAASTPVASMTSRRALAFEEEVGSEEPYDSVKRHQAATIWAINDRVVDDHHRLFLGVKLIRK